MNPISIDTPEEIPALYEGPALDLPPGAVQNSDGSVTLTLGWPKTLKFRTGDQVREEPIDALTFHRVDGAAARKILGARDSSLTGFAASAKLTPARSSLIINALDAADGAAAGRVVTELLGGAGGGLPENATSTPDGVTLSLLFPVSGDDGEVSEIFFPRMTVAQRNQAQAAPDVLDYVAAKALGVTPKQAHELLDKMDGADLRGVNRVVLFLFGAGR